MMKRGARMTVLGRTDTTGEIRLTALRSHNARHSSHKLGTRLRAFLAMVCLNVFFAFSAHRAAGLRA